MISAFVQQIVYQIKRTRSRREREKAEFRTTVSMLCAANK